MPIVRRAVLALAPLTLAALGASCARDRAAAADSTSARAATSASAAATGSSAAEGDVAGANAAEAQATMPIAPGDTLVDSATLARASAPGRTMHDRTSFASAVRAGHKAMATWPAGPKTPDGAVFPAKRVIAFYGNPLSKKMGVLGEYPVDEMLQRLDREVARWKAADPSTPVQPALHLVAVVAQGSAGRDGMWRLRMDSTLIEKVYGWAKQRDALLFLDIQVSHSTVEQELPRLLPFLARPDVHLGLDPEFSMHYDREGLRPGAKIGTMMAKDVNYAVRTLAELVRQKNIPPKILVVHRFTKKMVPNAEEIRPDARVQVVMDMDGWGPPWLKYDSYRDYEVAHPVQYTGFKLFFHNDAKKGDPLLTPRELLTLRPKPVYIQYQ